MSLVHVVSRSSGREIESNPAQRKLGNEIWSQKERKYLFLSKRPLKQNLVNIIQLLTVDCVVNLNDSRLKQFLEDSSFPRSSLLVTQGIAVAVKIAVINLNRKIVRLNKMPNSFTSNLYLVTHLNTFQNYLSN